jgi:protein ImuB
MAGVRTLVVVGDDWPVLAAGVAPDEPAAVVRANRVTACSPAARVEGIDVGQRRREAQGRCPDLVVLEPDDARDARVFEEVVAAVETFTPRLEITRPGRCAVATRGPSRYFGGDEALAALVHERVDARLVERGWPGAAAVGVADGPFAAGLAAESAGGGGGSARVQVVPVGATARFLAPMPVEVLGRAGLADAPGLVDVLRRLGLRTLGSVAALAAADLVARFGLDGQAAHRLASGLDERPPDTRIPAPVLRVEDELDPPAERVDAAAFVAKSLADDLHAQLDRLGLACTRVAVLAETEHGESLERRWRHEGALTPGAIADRVRWQLDGWLNGSAAHRPTSGITLLALVPDEVVAATGRQLGFWGGEAAVDERAVRAFARVQGLLGADAVTVPEWRGGRGPADQVVRVPVHAVDLDGGGSGRPAARPDSIVAPWPGRLPAPAPATVAVEPIPVEVLDREGVPVGVSGRGLVSAAPATVSSPSSRPGVGVGVVGWAGPWLADERWWDPPAHRRRARFQLVTADGRAHLLAVEGGRWWLEATYD